MKNFIFILLVFALFSCNSSNDSSSSTATATSTEASVNPLNSDGYEVTDIGGGYKMLVKKDAKGNLVEQGTTLNGKRFGTWVFYHPDRELPQSISSFIDDKFTGIYLELTNRGQITMMANYKENELHGKYGKYKFGRTEEEAFYDEGQLNGKYVKYFPNTNNIQQEVNYKNGKQHGKMKFFDEEGNVTMEYEYKNGKKIGGGVVNK